MAVDKDYVKKILDEEQKRGNYDFSNPAGPRVGNVNLVWVGEPEDITIIRAQAILYSFTKRVWLKISLRYDSALQAMIIEEIRATKQAKFNAPPSDNSFLNVETDNYRNDDVVKGILQSLNNKIKKL